MTPSLQRLVLLFLGAQLLDVTTTYLALTRYNLVEFNPISSFLFTTQGLEPVMVFKLIFSLLMVAGLHLLPAFRSSIRVSLGIVTMITGLVVISNASLIFLNAYPVTFDY